MERAFEVPPREKAKIKEPERRGRPSDRMEFIET